MEHVDIFLKLLSSLLNAWSTSMHFEKLSKQFTEFLLKIMKEENGGSDHS